MAQETYKGDVLQKIAGIGFIVGAVLTTVFNVLYPHADDPSDVSQVLTELADNETFSLIVFLALAVGYWVIMIGVVGVYRSISTGSAAVWGRLGFYGVVVGTTLATTSFAIGLASTGAAADWLAVGSGMSTIEYTIAAALNAAGNSIFFMSIILFWMALAFLAIGMVLSSVYSKWLGWVLLVLGVATVVVAGVPMALSDLSQTQDIIFGVLAGLTTLWALVLGVWITRREIQTM